MELMYQKRRLGLPCTIIEFKATIIEFKATIIEFKVVVIDTGAPTVAFDTSIP